MNEREDPLASAVCRCWSHERCPAELRRRLTDRITAGRARSRHRWFIGPAGLSAAAAVALLAGGGLFWSGRPAPSAAVAATILPVSLESDLIQTHDHCSRGKTNHQNLPVPRSNGYAIAASLRSRLDRPVMVSHPSDPAWQFAGASVCSVGNVKSAHLVFRRSDGDSLSLFSLPRSAAPTAVDGQQFQGESNQHPIVGFVKHGAVYCLVGSGCPADVSVARLADIRQQLERQVVVADATPVAPVDGELIYGTGR
jgi:hypothetical protein